MEMENTQREDMTGMVGQENMAETAGQDMTETAGQEEEIQLPQKCRSAGVVHRTD